MGHARSEESHWEGEAVLPPMYDAHFDAHVPQRPEDAEGDFPSVGDEDSTEAHGPP